MAARTSKRDDGKEEEDNDWINPTEEVRGLVSWSFSCQAQAEHVEGVGHGSSFGGDERLPYSQERKK